jgi:5-methylcytosine-specific restriction endonuclease McrA
MMEKPYRDWPEYQKQINRNRAKAWAKANPDRVRVVKHRYYTKHLEKTRAYNQRYRMNHLEEIKSYCQRHRIEIAKYNRIYRKVNHNKIKERERVYRDSHLDEVREMRRIWRISNPNRVIANNQKRRSRIAGNGGSFTADDWELMKAEYGYRCPCCNRKEPNIKLTVDHITPISEGGKNLIENIQPLCKQCNSKKHTDVMKFNPTPKENK